MPSPLGWTLVALVILCFLALLRRRRTPLRLADGAPLPDDAFDAVVACLVLSELLPQERRYVLERARSRLVPGGLLVVADEVVPRTRWGRVRHALFRLPVAALTWLLTQQTTHPLADLSGAVCDAGFVDVAEERLWHDDFALVTARRQRPS